MDRREFFLKTGLAGVGLNTSTVREAVGSNAALALRRRDPHGKLTLSNDAMDWHFEWHDGKLASLGFYNKLSEHAFKFSASRELALNFSVSDQRVEIPWWKFTISPGVTAVPPEQEPGHGDAFFVVDDIQRITRGDSSQQLNLAQSFRRIVAHGNLDCEGASVAFTDQQAAAFKCGNMFGYCGAGFNAEVTCNLSVGGFVTVSLEKPGDEIENLFLALGAWKH